MELNGAPNLVATRNGPVPKDWPIQPLGELAFIGSGVTLGRDLEGINTTELPYLRVENVQDGFLDLNEIKKVRVRPGEVNRYLLQAGDVLMTEGGDFDKLGRGAIWPGEIAPCLHQNHIFRVRVDRARLEPEFLSALIGSRYGKRYFLRIAKQTTNLATINKTQLRAFPVPCAPLKEQNKIVRILEAADTAIDKTRAALEKVECVRRGLITGLMTNGIDKNGRLRNLENTPSEFTSYPQGRFPSEWRLKRLGELGKWLSGGTPEKTNQSYWKGTVPWLTPKDMKRFVISDTIDHITQAGLENGTCLTEPETVFIVVRLMILAHTFPVCISTRAMAFNQDVKGIRCYPEVDPKFVAFWFTNAAGLILNMVTDSSHGTKRLELRQLQNRIMFLPPLSEQQMIVKLLEKVDRDIVALESKRLLLQNLKRGLLQDLLTGRVRVPVPAS